MCITVGKVSFELALMLTWSLGWTGCLEPFVPPKISIARFEMTSLAFMFDCVPEPVCHTVRGKWSSRERDATSEAACCIALPSLGSSKGGFQLIVDLEGGLGLPSPNVMFAVAAAPLRIPNARMTGGGMRS